MVSVVVHKTFQIPARNMTLSGTNLIADHQTRNVKTTNFDRL